MNEPQVEIAKEWLSERCDVSYHGRICAYALKEYIAELEADKELLDKLREWLRTGPVDGRLGSEYTNGYLQVVNYVARVIEEQNHE